MTLNTLREKLLEELEYGFGPEMTEDSKQMMRNHLSQALERAHAEGKKEGFESAIRALNCRLNNPHE